MKRGVVRITICLLLGAVINIAVAWGCVFAHGPIQHDWCPYHNPVVRDDLPLVVHVTSRFGFDIVTGCDRSGTLLARYPDEVKTYKSSVWWPDVAVGANTYNYAVASGWPAFAVTCWRTVRGEDETAFPGVIHAGVT